MTDKCQWSRKNEETIVREENFKAQVQRQSRDKVIRSSNKNKALETTSEESSK